MIQPNNFGKYIYKINIDREISIFFNPCVLQAVDLIVQFLCEYEGNCGINSCSGSHVQYQAWYILPITLLNGFTNLCCSQQCIGEYRQNSWKKKERKAGAFILAFSFYSGRHWTDLLLSGKGGLWAQKWCVTTIITAAICWVLTIILYYFI